MSIQINPRTLENLEHICEILYKLHPSVLYYLVDMERTLGCVLGLNDIRNLSEEQRNLLKDIEEQTQEDTEDPDDDNVIHFSYYDDNLKEFLKDPEFKKILNDLNINENNFKGIKRLFKYFDKVIENDNEFRKLIKYLQLDTDEYIPIKINIEVEDPVIRRKVRELVRALERTGAPEKFYLNKREIDCDAYFAEGYNLTMNEEQEKKKRKFLDNRNYEDLKEILIKKKLYQPHF